ncbi:cleavage induced hypothetical protein [Thraustotheca clavata]|uniref:PX domain-containing protein n=1 Tax=Thraustotheca clavata TaxID=74557 RepID=A0A1V9ZWZ0_9STRA|nr:cleavage induced hypothetical protein [Thraustotheca clavata]
MDRFCYSRNGGVDLKCSVRVCVKETLVIEGKTYYKVAMKSVKSNPVKEWEVLHRYSEFLALKQTLLNHLQDQSDCGKACPGCLLYMKALEQFDFPRKHLFSSNTTVVVKYRQVSLQAFVAMLASHTFTTSPRCPTCSGYMFDLVRGFFIGNDNPNIVEKLPSPIKGGDKSESIRTALTVDNFLEVHPVAKDAVVGSMGEFVSSPPKPSPGQPFPTKIHAFPPPAPGQMSPTSEFMCEATEEKKPATELLEQDSKKSMPTSEVKKPEVIKTIPVPCEELKKQEMTPLDIDRFSFESGEPILTREDSEQLSFEGIHISEDDTVEDELNLDFMKNDPPKQPIVRQPSQPMSF